MLSSATPLVLGSGSPRRKDMLEQLGLPLVVDPPDVDESYRPGKDARSYVREIALLKLSATLEKWHRSSRDFSAVLCADTVVVLDGQVLQKPEDEAHARGMLSQLVGRTHQVLTAYSLWTSRTATTRSNLVSSDVTFRAAQQWEVDWYARTKEGWDKAGGYAVQGLGAVFVDKINGSYSNVVGLPMSELWTDLCDLRLVGARVQDAGP
jgi:septum formation protein